MGPGPGFRHRRRRPDADPAGGGGGSGPAPGRTPGRAPGPGPECGPGRRQPARLPRRPGWRRRRRAGRLLRGPQRAGPELIRLWHRRLHRRREGPPWYAGPRRAAAATAVPMIKAENPFDSADLVARWQANAERRAAFLQVATERMLDTAGVAAGAHVLDLGTGTGDTAVLAALRVGPEGRVLATDVSEAMVRAAAEA